MENIITLKNDVLTLRISSYGAEIHSIKENASCKERIWTADPDVWGKHAPLLWPVCGGLKDDKYTYLGKEYTMVKHGFGQRSEFIIEDISESYAVFLLKSDEESKKCFPFDYELRVKYTLTDNRIDCLYSVKNLTDGEMYFSIGAHEAYLCKGKTEDYSLLFDKEETLDSIQVDGTLFTDKTVRVLENKRELNLSDEFFMIDALAFKNINSEGVSLINNKTGDKIRVDFKGFPYLLIWKKPGAEYVCIEPWCGLPDSVTRFGDITEKEGINSLQKGGIFERTHSITID